MVTIYLPEKDDLLDLYPNTSPKLTISTFDITNLEQRSSEFSESITVPATAKNIKLLGINALAGPKSAPYRQIDCIIRSNGTDYITGFLKLISRNSNELELLIFGNQAKWIQTISDAMVSDLPRLPYSWTYEDAINISNYLDVEQRPEAPWHVGLVYDGLLELQGASSNTWQITPVLGNRAWELPYHELTQLVTIKYIFEQIFKVAGFNIIYPNSSYSDTSTNSPNLFRRLCLPAVYRQQYSDNWINRRKAIVSNSGNVSFIDGALITFVSTSFNSAGWWVSNKYYAGTAIEVDLNLQCKYRNIHGSNSVSLEIRYEYDGSNFTVGEFIVNNSSTSFQDYNNTVRLVIPYGAVLKLQVFRRSGGGSGNIFEMGTNSETGLFQLSINPTGRSLNNEKNIDGSGVEDDEMNLLARVGEIKQADLIKYISIIMGWFYETKGTNIYIREFDSINNPANNEDWSDNIDFSEVGIDYGIDGIAQSNFFQYDNDEDDLIKNNQPISKLYEGNVPCLDLTISKENLAYKAPFSGTIDKANKRRDYFTSGFVPKYKDMSGAAVIDYSVYPSFGAVFRSLFNIGKKYCTTWGANYYLSFGEDGVTNYPMWLGQKEELTKWELVDRESIFTSYQPKPRILLMQAYDIELAEAVYRPFYYDDFSKRLPVQIEGYLVAKFNISQNPLFAKWEEIQIDFNTFLELNSRLIKSAYKYPERVKVRIRLTANDIQNITQGTAKLIDIITPQIPINGAYLLNSIEQFSPEELTTVVELVRLK